MIAERFGVQLRTVYLWFSDPLVKEEMRRRSAQIGERIMDGLAENVLIALEQLRAVFKTALAAPRRYPITLMFTK